jgi:hypothetical protein
MSWKDTCAVPNCLRCLQPGVPFSKHVRVQGVAQREDVTGGPLVLFVVIDEQRKPLAVSGRGASGGPQLSPPALQIAGEIAGPARARDRGRSCSHRQHRAQLEKA